MKYLISHQGQESGPFTLDEIVAKVRAKEIELFDYILDAETQDWVLLMEHSELSQKLKSNKPPRPPTGPVQASAPQKPQGRPALLDETAPAHEISEWFVLKGENKFGPFSYHDVVKMLQQKVVFPFDFIWHAGMTQWTRVVELQDFAPERIRQLFEKTGSKKTDVFVSRKFPRRKFVGRVIVHDNLSLWKGQGFEISQGGVGITMKNALVVPGQQLFVHFNGFEDFPAFNAVCEVVSKKFVNSDAPVEYGLRFLSLSQDVQEEFYKKVA